jgi:hypothetical protein
MILLDAKALSEVVTIQLETAIREYLSFEAAECRVTESEVASFALGLLAHYRRAAGLGASLLLSSTDEPAASLVIHATTIPADTRLQSSVPVDELEAHLLRLGGPGPEPGPHLRLVH